MIALILCAGYGTRLRPLTYRIPKPLIEFGGVPLVGHWINYARKLKCEKIYVNVSYMGADISKYILNSHPDIVVIPEDKPRGTAVTIRELIEKTPEEDVFIAHGDNLSLFEPSMFLTAYHGRGSRCIGTMMTFDTDSPSSCGMVHVASGVMSDYIEKPVTHNGTLANAAVFIFDCSELMKVYEKFPGARDFCGDLMPRLLCRINVYHNGTYHRDIGTLDALRMARIEWPKVMEALNK